VLCRNLSALSQTEDKVTAFSLSGPLFGNSKLNEGLGATGLDANLHTVRALALPNRPHLHSESSLSVTQPRRGFFTIFCHQCNHL
jgi:hypothetical protein